MAIDIKGAGSGAAPPDTSKRMQWLAWPPETLSTNGGALPSIGREVLTGGDRSGMIATLGMQGREVSGLVGAQNFAQIQRATWGIAPHIPYENLAPGLDRWKPTFTKRSMVYEFSAAFPSATPVDHLDNGIMWLQGTTTSPSGNQPFISIRRTVAETIEFNLRRFTGVAIDETIDITALWPESNFGIPVNLEFWLLAAKEGSDGVLEIYANGDRIIRRTGSQLPIQLNTSVRSLNLAWGVGAIGAGVGQVWVGNIEQYISLVDRSGVPL